MEKGYRPKLVLGLALLILGSILVFGGRTEEHLPNEDTFASEPVRLQGFSQYDNPNELLPTKIIIPKLSIDLDIKKSEVIDGYWKVYNDSAGWGDGSGLPGKNGNQVIFAHAREGLFLPLKNIQTGDVIYVTTSENWFSYKVVDIKEVYPNQIEVIAPTEDETLTLYTCSGYQDAKRLIVVAKRA